MLVDSTKECDDPTGFGCWPLGPVCVDCAAAHEKDVAEKKNWTLADRGRAYGWD